MFFNSFREVTLHTAMHLCRQLSRFSSLLIFASLEVVDDKKLGKGGKGEDTHRSKLGEDATTVLPSLDWWIPSLPLSVLNNPAHG